MEDIQKYSFKTFMNLGMPFIKAFKKTARFIYKRFNKEIGEGL